MKQFFTQEDLKIKLKKAEEENESLKHTQQEIISFCTYLKMVKDNYEIMIA